MGIWALMDLAECGLRNCISPFSGAFKPMRLQYQDYFANARIDFNGELYLDERKFPALTGKLSIWPYTGEDPRHYDVTGRIEAEKSGKKTITEAGENQGKWHWKTTWFDFKFSEVTGIDKTKSYANVIEIDDDDEEE